MTAYQQLEDRFRRLSALGEAEGVLHWDMSTMMPEGGAGARSEQLAALAVTRHELLTGSEVAELLDSAEEASGGLDPWQTANLRAMRRRVAPAPPHRPQVCVLPGVEAAACVLCRIQQLGDLVPGQKLVPGHRQCRQLLAARAGAALGPQGRHVPVQDTLRLAQS